MEGQKGEIGLHINSSCRAKEDGGKLQTMGHGVDKVQKGVINDARNLALQFHYAFLKWFLAVCVDGCYHGQQIGRRGADTVFQRDEGEIRVELGIGRVELGVCNYDRESS